MLIELVVCNLLLQHKRKKSVSIMLSSSAVELMISSLVKQALVKVN